MTKSRLPDIRLVCGYCGLESAVSHSSTLECIEVLQREANRLRDHMIHGRPDRGCSKAISSLSLLGPRH